MGQVGDQFQSSDGRWHDSASAANDWNLQSNAGGGPDKLTMAEAELAGAAVGAGIVLFPIFFKILVKILTIVGFVFAILPGLILGIIMKIPLLGRVIHTAIFAVIVTIFLVSICLTVGTAFGQYEGITFGFDDLNNIAEKAWNPTNPETGERMGVGAGMGLFNALLDTYYPAVLIPSLIIGILAAIIFFWGKLYYWEKKWDILDFIIVTGIALAVCIIGGIITMTVGKFAPMWIKGLLNSIFIALAFYFWYTQAKEDRPWTEEEIKQMTRAAEAGDAKAQDDLSTAYCNANGVERDMEKSIMWVEKAAAQGYKKAIEYLSNSAFAGGNIYAYCGKDEKEVALLTRLAEAGNPNAQYALGYNYYHYYGIFKKDEKKGIMWMEKAAAQGQQSAIAELEKLKKEGSI